MKRLLFFIFSALLALVFAIALIGDITHDWNHYQRQFLRASHDRLSRQEQFGLLTGSIKQVMVKDLHRVDRCTTCHLAMEKPQLALGVEPFKEHPGNYLKWHPIEKFGCTVCHGGQGLATQTNAAHGDVKHWEEPFLRGSLVQASCRQCHGNLQQIEDYAPMLVKGRELFKAKGCYGCHVVKDFGGTISQDLTEVGSKSYQLIEADFEMMQPPHDRIHWFLRKLKNPRMLNPGVRPEQLPPGEEEVFPSAMPNFALSDQEIQALTVYLLSLTASNVPSSYMASMASEPPAPTAATPVEQGRLAFEKYGCAACHGNGGVGGRRNPNSGLGQEVPPLLYAKAYYGDHVDDLKNVIRNGRQPVPRAQPSRPNPSLYMPAWKDRISDEDIDALIAYLFSLSDKLPQTASTN